MNTYNPLAMPLSKKIRYTVHAAFRNHTVHSKFILLTVLTRHVLDETSSLVSLQEYQ